jgi:hypothetical protein
MFTWTEVAKSRAIVERQQRAREAMYRREIEDRAGLLLRLGRTPAAIKARLSSNVGWDFELHGKPAHAAEVDKLVDAVVRRQTTKGETR